LDDTPPKSQESLARYVPELKRELSTQAPGQVTSKLNPQQWCWLNRLPDKSNTSTNPVPAFAGK
jgi:hypothetical protein